MLSIFIKAFVTFLVVVAPLKVTPIFSVLTKDKSTSSRYLIALRAVIISALVLVFFALFGNWLLDALDINIYSFRIAGGFLLLVLGMSMVFEQAYDAKYEIHPEKQHDISVFPLAIPLIAGPATITSVILLTDPEIHNFAQQLVIFGALALVLVITYFCFVGVTAILRLLGPGFLNVISRVLGIILVALAFQMIIMGIRSAFPRLIA